MENDQKRLSDGLQTLVVLLAIPLGLIPLIQKIFGSQQSGLFRFIFNEPMGNAQWIVPVAVIAGAAVLIMAIEELLKQHR